MLSRYFTSLAGLGAATAITVALASMIPDYPDPELAHVIPPPTGTSTLQFRDPAYSSYQMQYGSIYEALDCANDNYTITFTDETPEHAIKKEYNDAAGNEREQLCIWASFDPFKDMTSSERRTISTDKYPDDEQFDLQTYFQEKFKPSKEYRAWENERMEEAINAIAQDSFIQDAHDKWKSQSDYEDVADAEEQYTLKREVFQRVSDHIRDSFGLESIDVSMYVFQPYQMDTLAFYSPATDSIAVNYSAYGNVTRSMERALTTIIEEAKHSVDSAMMGMYMRGEISNDDIRAEHAAAIWLNTKEYIGSGKSWRFPMMDNLWDFAITMGQPDFRAYERQYIERNAKKVSERSAEKILEKLKCREGSNMLSCIGYKITHAL